MKKCPAPLYAQDNNSLPLAVGGIHVGILSGVRGEQ